MGLLDKLLRNYDRARFTVISGEEASILQISEGVLQGVTTIDQNVSAFNVDLLI